MKKIAETEIPQLPVPAPPVEGSGGTNGGAIRTSLHRPRHRARPFQF